MVWRRLAAHTSGTPPARPMSRPGPEGVPDALDAVASDNNDLKALAERLADMVKPRSLNATLNGIEDNRFKTCVQNGPGRVGAQSGLGPGPGWGPYGPLCFLLKM